MTFSFKKIMEKGGVDKIALYFPNKELKQNFIGNYKKVFAKEKGEIFNAIKPFENSPLMACSNELKISSAESLDNLGYDVIRVERTIILDNDIKIVEEE